MRARLDSSGLEIPAFGRHRKEKTGVEISLGYSSPYFKGKQMKEWDRFSSFRLRLRGHSCSFGEVRASQTMATGSLMILRA